jgi:hypothetical protein
MLANQATTFAIIFLGVPIFILVMLVPALLELRKPKDAGPRRIKDYTFSANMAIEEILTTNLEEKHSVDQTHVMSIGNAISVLMNIEA